MKIIMKKIIYIFILVYAGLFMSCKDFLETPSQSSLDESVIFSIPALASKAIDGIKVPMGETNSYRGRFLTHYGSNTDIEWYNSSTATTDRANLAKYVNSPTNTDMNTTNNAWAMIYSGIERANICIRGIRKYGKPAEGNEMGQYLGEALTLRAIYYADLLKGWGDVVARFEPITPETIYLPKSNRDVIYKQLIADLGEASNLVGWPGSGLTASTEKINKAFVKGFRARLCLVAAGYSQRGATIAPSSDPDLSVANLYPIALQECLDVINSGYAHLEPTFEQLWRKNCEENVAAGNESLWEIPFADGRGRHLYTYGVKHSSVDQYTRQPQGGQYGPLPNVFYDYDVKDTRRDITCVPYQYNAAVTGAGDTTAFQVPRALNSWCFGKWRYEWMRRKVTSTNDDGINKIYMRYAEVLLMAAEIQNELNGPAAAAPYLKQIRQRAFASSDWSTKVDAYVNALGSKDQMFAAIVKEHGFEFCGEMERKQALIRWNLLKAKMDEAKTKMLNLRAQTGEYADVPANLYYNYVLDEKLQQTVTGKLTKLKIWGLNRGEFADMSATYTAGKVTAWVGPTKIDDARLAAYYVNNPDQNQFWPIWQVFIDASNGMLNNDPL
jgi:starch-binding outer membrane protein, SusD/RagB family